MTIDNKKKTDRNGDCESVHAAGRGCLHVSSLYHMDDDLSSTLSPMTGVALDGSLTLMGVSIDHLPLLARIAIAKLWTYENQV